MKLALLGIGKMGKLVDQLAQQQGHSTVPIAKIAEADVCIEFSSREAVLDHLKLAAQFKKNIVIGTTGWHEELELAKRIVEEHGIGAVYSPNFSLGMHLFLQIVARAAKVMHNFHEYESALFEMHHSKKLDSPSGTALLLQQCVEAQTKKKCPVAALRVGSIPGTHTLTFDSPFDQITLTHEARSKEGFAQGALVAAKWIYGKTGFYHFSECFDATYTMRGK